MKPTHGEESSMNVPDWKNELQPQLRELLVGKMRETLERYCPFSDPASVDVLKKMVIRFEEKIFTSATSKSDYSRKISLKILALDLPRANGSVPFDDVDDCSSPTSSLESANSPAASA
ncbi:hypothetical protein LWI28_016605 [Acer negundo]|uniref:Mediator complex subunit 15 KIX domain-containing protein n=1 Tax=Acer negundo TaxID=4023 RepID=A0AAD5NWZ5_ACENE|nr:hypothetical protein LWI28_016605 [Acer negundo]KAK4837866.1 hypothetical protein QYF36_009063 [Acer negundo]